MWVNNIAEVKFMTTIARKIGEGNEIWSMKYEIWSSYIIHEMILFEVKLLQVKDPCVIHTAAKRIQMIKYKKPKEKKE